MELETIIFEKDENVAIVKFNRPEALNAVNPQMVTDLNRVVEDVERDRSAGAMVLTGNGNRAFVAGADISVMADFSPLEARRFVRDMQDVLFRIEKLPIPVIACVNGFALGGGAEIAMACDFIYASEKAKLGQPEINLGLIPGFGGTQRLSRLVGKARAKEMCMTGMPIGATEAKEIGLVNKVFSPDKLYDETIRTAKLMANKAKTALRAIKRCIDQGVEINLKAACYIETESFGICFTSPDAKEGMSSFLEKRKPAFEKELL